MASKDRVLSEVQRLADGSLDGIGEKKVFDESCIAHRALLILSDKWKLLVLYALIHQTKRYGELQRQIHGVSPKMLVQTLRALEQHGMVERRIYPEVPPRVEYSLTEFGESLVAPLAVLTGWAVEHHEAVNRIWNETRTRKGAARDLDLHDPHLGVEAE